MLKKISFFKKTNFSKRERKFRQRYQYYLLRVQRNFLRKSNYFEKKQKTLFYYQFSISGFEQKILGLLGENFQQRCHNCILRVQMNILRFTNFFPNCEQILANSLSDVNVIGKHRVRNVPFERKIFLPCFINMAENNKICSFRKRFRLKDILIFQQLIVVEVTSWNNYSSGPMDGLVDPYSVAHHNCSSNEFTVAAATKTVIETVFSPQFT